MLAGRPRQLHAVRAVRRAPVGERHLARGLGRDLRPVLERPAARRLDVAPTPPACRSCPASCAGTRWPPGEINHALRFTAPADPRQYIYPARHEASARTARRCRRWGCGSGSRPPRTWPGLSHDAQVIAVALQRYGMILADNGSPWYVSGASDPRFDDDVLHELDRFKGSDLEVVDTTGLVNGP